MFSKYFTKNNFILFSFSICSFFLSYYILPYYKSGDQTYYRLFYEEINNYNIYDGFFFYRDALGTLEPAYYLISFVFSKLIDKDILMSAANAVFGYFLSKKLTSIKVNTGVIFILLSNFYLLVLFLSAERLKFSLMFLLIAASTFGARKYIFYSLSLFSQVQSALLLLGEIAYRIYRNFRLLIRLKINSQTFKSLILLIAFSGFLFILQEHLSAKIESNTAAGATGKGLSATAKPVLFMLISLYYAKTKRIAALLYGLILTISSFFLGAERITILSYIVFMSYALRINRGINIGVIATSLYFSYKGFNFINSIVIYGDGFYEALTQK